jgi:membrane protein DedA with SNARE-associated domain
MPGSRLTLRHFVPLIGFVVPTAIMGYGVMIPQSCIAGVNELTLGFAGSIVGACVTYWLGLRALLRERGRSDEA